VTAVLAFVFGGTQVRADDHDQAKRLRESGRILPLEQIVEKARKLHSGHLIETELEHRGERYVYEIELLDEHGKVWELRFDAATGELVDTEQEH
jgi:uncharacterized membrane protein YkoI